MTPRLYLCIVTGKRARKIVDVGAVLRIVAFVAPIIGMLATIACVR